MVDDIRPDDVPENKNLKDIPLPEIPDEDPTDLVDNESGSVGSDNSKKPDKSDKKRLHHKITEFGMKLWPSTKRQKIIGAIIVIVVLIGGFFGVKAIQNMLSKRKPAVQEQIVQQPPSKTEPSKLTGVEVPKEINTHHITSIMIENSPDARPQSGLLDAGVVFEAVAEGGITRFNALFLDSQPSYIGPVRSVRPYYVDMFLPFNPVFVHAGGSGAGLAKVKKDHVQDLGCFHNPQACHRISSRYAPHNLFTSIKAIDDSAKSHHYKATNFTSYPRKPEPKASALKPKITNIDINLSGFLYNVHYDYSKKSNSYLRSQAGGPHRDYKSHKQIHPKVVVALVMRYSHNGIYSVYKTTGSGKMYVFQDGQVQIGTWKKKNASSQFQFLDKKGNPLELNPGQTWITLVTSGAVSYK